MKKVEQNKCFNHHRSSLIDIKFNVYFINGKALLLFSRFRYAIALFAFNSAATPQRSRVSIDAKVLYQYNICINQSVKQKSNKNIFKTFIEFLITSTFKNH